MFGLVVLGFGLAWAAWGMLARAQANPAPAAPAVPPTPEQRAQNLDRSAACGVRPYDFAYTERWTQQRYGFGLSLNDRLAKLRAELSPRRWPDFVRRIDCALNPANSPPILVPGYRQRAPLANPFLKGV